MSTSLPFVLFVFMINHEAVDAMHKLLLVHETANTLAVNVSLLVSRDIHCLISKKLAGLFCNLPLIFIFTCFANILYSDS